MISHVFKQFEKEDSMFIDMSLNGIFVLFLYIPKLLFDRPSALFGIKVTLNKTKGYVK